MIIVDTNIWRELGHENGHPLVKAWATTHADELVLSAIVLAEIHQGVALRPEGKPKQLLLEWAKILSMQFAGSILPFEEVAAEKFGALAAASRKLGLNPGEIDIQIAAQAAVNHFAIATRNVKDFEHFGLDLINPWDG